VKSCRLSKRGPTASDPRVSMALRDPLRNGGWVAIEAVPVCRRRNRLTIGGGTFESERH
jgi:hypothetical protein